MSLRESHQAGLDVLGTSMNLGTFVPWLGLVGGALSGLTGGAGGAAGGDAATKAAIQKAIEAEKQKQAAAKAAADAARTRTILYVGLGVLGVTVLGTAAFLLTRK